MIAEDLQVCALRRRDLDGGRLEVRGRLQRLEAVCGARTEDAGSSLDDAAAVSVRGRAAAASDCSGQGASRGGIVRDIVGHSALEVTMTIYAHVSLDEKRRALATLAERLS